MKPLTDRQLARANAAWVAAARGNTPLALFVERCGPTRTWVYSGLTPAPVGPGAQFFATKQSALRWAEANLVGASS